MKRFLVERIVPGAGVLDAGVVDEMVRRCQEAVAELHGKLEWQYSLRATDRFLCIFCADRIASIYEHAQIAEIPADRVIELVDDIDPRRLIERVGGHDVRTRQ